MSDLERIEALCEMLKLAAKMLDDPQCGDEFRRLYKMIYADLSIEMLSNKLETPHQCTLPITNSEYPEWKSKNIVDVNKLTTDWIKHNPPEEMLQSSVYYTFYEAYSDKMGIKKLSMQKFSALVENEGYDKRHNNKFNYWIKIRSIK
jgi:hypothetical protein